MADEEKIGKPWQDDELDAIIADYFFMLEAELSARPYVKAHHSAELMERIGRTHRSVFKHQNISAVLDELGLPWIPGYKPKRNYQAAIFGAIDRYLTAHSEFLTRSPTPTILAPEDEPPFVEPPRWSPSSLDLGSSNSFSANSILWSATIAIGRLAQPASPSSSRWSDSRGGRRATGGQACETRAPCARTRRACGALRMRF